MRKFTVFLCTSLLLSAALTPPAQAQYGTSFDYHDNLGNSYNNPNSALMGTAINGIMQQQVVSSAVRGSLGHSSPSPKKGPNSLLFTPRTPPLQKWLAEWGGNDPQKRRAAYNEWLGQNAIWKSEVASRGARPNDFAQLFTVAVMIGYEAYTGQRASNASFADINQNIGKVLLDTGQLRGLTNTRKNELLEQEMLSATFALYSRREGEKHGNSAQVAKGRDEAVKFLDKWWHGNHSEIVSRIAAKGGGAKGNAAPPKIIAATAPISFERAVQITNFSRVASTILPAKLRQDLAAAGNPEEIESVTGKLIESARQQLKGPAGGVPVDNVSRSMTYAIFKLYSLGMTPVGNPIGEGMRLPTQEQINALRHRLPQNLAGNTDFAHLSNLQKQELSETMLFVPTFAEELYNAGLQKKDRQLQTQAREMARSSFQRFFGVAPEGFTF